MMKKLLFALMTVGLLASASSCKKCGYCHYANGSNDDAVCSGGSDPLSNSLNGNDYKEVQANCQAHSGTWVKTK
jgi:hypothetical protein